MADDDFYELLEVPRSATPEEIKKAYRKLARELHPDTNPDPQAEERFKKVTLAYEVLADPDRRRQYDTFGIAGLRGSGGGSGPNDVFSAFGESMFSDLFESFFGAGFGGAQQQASGPPSGDDIEIVVEMSLADAAFGTSRELSIRKKVKCTTCSGIGAKEGTSPQTCSQCGGKGITQQVRQSLIGQMVTTSPCRKCMGTGQEIPEPCPTCAGEGRTTEARDETIEIPAGVDNGFSLRLAARGNAGPRGGTPGNLYVHIRVQSDERWARNGPDLHMRRVISFAQAALGTSIEIETLEGPEDLSIVPGTQTGEVLKLKGKGVPVLQGRGRGDLYCEIIVETPIGLTAEQDALIRELAKQRGEDVSPPDPSLLKKIKSAFS